MISPDDELVYEILSRIDEATTRIIDYAAPIQAPTDFTANSENQMRLDAIGMMLIAMGENIKRLDRHINPSQLARFPDVNWRGAKGIRDFLSHSYFEMQPEIIFKACKQDIPLLRDAVRVLKEEMSL